MNAPKLEGNTLDDCYNTLDTVLQEVAMADEAILSIVCKRLCEENDVLGNPIIEVICIVLSKINRMPSTELLKATMQLLWDGNILAISTIRVVEVCSIRILGAENANERR